MEIILVAALGKERQLGLDNQLLWKLPGDLPRFKEMTMGSPIVMGRKTYDSIGRPLPGRKNIVITRDDSLVIEGVEITHSTEQALTIAKQENDDGKVFVIGGGEIYSLFLPVATSLELTLVEDSPAADAFFPEYGNEFNEVSRQENQVDALRYDYVTYRRNAE